MYFASVPDVGAPTLRRALANFGHESCPQASLTQSVDAALPGSRSVQATRAGTWDLSGPLDMVRKTLVKDGAGFCVFVGAVGAERAAAALGEAAEIVQDLLVVFFNTTGAAEATARCTNGDSGRHQPILDAGCLALLSLVPGLRAGLAAMEDMCLGACWYFFDALLFSLSCSTFFEAWSRPAAGPHRRRARFSVGDGAPRLLGGLLEIHEDTRLIAWPGLQLTGVEHEVGTLIEEEAGRGGRRGTGRERGAGRAWGRGSRTLIHSRTWVVAREEENEATCAATEGDVFLLRVPGFF